MLFSEPKISQSSSCGARKRGAASKFQCSSASRKFLNRTAEGEIIIHLVVSVLFSEPKISQCVFANYIKFLSLFQCSSASRKFLNICNPSDKQTRFKVSVLFSEPKISQSYYELLWLEGEQVSVLFSEPKISQS